MRKALVMMATYEGSLFLPEQLESLECQTWPALDLLVSDDGSTDGTMQILAKWKERWQKGSFEVIAGPQDGFANNFRSLILAADTKAEFFFFCDQDDVWLPSKMQKAVEAVKAVAPDLPLLYCTRSRILSEVGSSAMSPLFSKPPSFENALVQSIGGGNTMLMNRKAFLLVQESCRRTEFVSHDWWAYLIVSGVGGLVLYDPDPQVLYRQHGQNLVGQNKSIAARLNRINRLMSGGFEEWVSKNLLGLEACSDLLTAEARSKLLAFSASRKGNMFQRLYRLRKSGVYRQTLEGQIAIWLASVVNRL